MSYKNKDLADLDFDDIDALIAKLTPEEIEILNNEVDPDVSTIYPNHFFNLIYFYFIYFNKRTRIYHRQTDVESRLKSYRLDHTEGTI